MGTSQYHTHNQGLVKAGESYVKAGEPFCLSSSLQVQLRPKEATEAQEPWAKA